MSQYLPGHEFRLVLRWFDEEFSIWVDGKMTGIFKPKSRGGPMQVDTVFIHGDVILYKVWVNTHMSNVFIDTMEWYDNSDS